MDYLLLCWLSYLFNVTVYIPQYISPYCYSLSEFPDKPIIARVDIDWAYFCDVSSVSSGVESDKKVVCAIVQSAKFLPTCSFNNDDLSGVDNVKSKS